MTPAAHIATICTLLMIFGALIIGSFIQQPRNTRRNSLRRWLKFHGVIK